MAATNHNAILPERATVGELGEALRRALAPSYGPGEAAAMTRIVLEESLRMKPVDAVLRRSQEVLPETLRRVDAVAARLLRGEPIQYVYGRTQWYGAELRVTPDVLIPRPETEGLVDMIAEDWCGRRDLRVMDLCTGSGCIATALARVLPFASVEGVDISDAALAVARDNARRQRVSVAFARADVLDMGAPPRPAYDIVVANPPYIPEGERATLAATVAAYEPAAALFVPDADPLLFYRAIAAYARGALRPGGMLYLELDPAGANGVAALLRRAGLADVDLRRDYAGRLRFAVAAR